MCYAWRLLWKRGILFGGAPPGIGAVSYGCPLPPWPPPPPPPLLRELPPLKERDDGVLLTLRPLKDPDLVTGAWLIVGVWLVDSNLFIIWVAVTGFCVDPFVFPILGKDPEEGRFGDVVDALAVFPVLDPACRFIIALAPT
jgi:hypothetical protein